MFTPAAFLLSSFLLSETSLAQAQPPPADTTRVVRGFGNQQYAWGTLVLRNGQRLQGFLPVANGSPALYGAVPYYPLPPDSKPAQKPKLWAPQKVRVLRVQGRHSEWFAGSKGAEGQLATRLLSGPVELFVATAPQAPMLSALGSNPVLSSPADNNAFLAASGWYLRRANGAVLPVSPEQFANQVSTFLADDPELAKRVAAGQAGYRLAELENVVRQYNQRARR